MMMDRIEKRIVQVFLLFISIYFIYMVRSILTPFIFGFILAYFLHPFVDKMEKKMPRTIASLIMVSAVSLIFLILFFLVVPLLFYQGIEIIKNVISYVSNLDERASEKINNLLLFLKIDGMEGIKTYLESYSDNIIKHFGSVLNKTISSSIAIINVATMIIIIPVALYYFLKSWHEMIKIIRGLLPLSMTERAKDLFKQIDEILQAYIKGQFNICMIFTVYYMIAYWFAGLKMWLFAAILGGLMTFIPTLGGIIGGLITLFIAYFQWGFEIWKLLIILCIMVVETTLENLLTPNLLGDKVKLNPLWIMFALFVGGKFFGFIGMLFALPAASVIGVVVRFFMKQKVESNAKRLIDG